MSWPTAFLVAAIVWAFAALCIAAMRLDRSQKCPRPGAHTADEWREQRHAKAP